MKRNLFGLWAYLTVVCCQANSDMEESENSSVRHNYDFTGRDFRNTQTKRLCLLARLNASFEIIYNSSHVNEVFVPEWASTSHSQCDYNFLSVLRLEFRGVSYQLYFKREPIKALHTQRTYCDHCDTGNWRLDEIEIGIENSSWIDEAFPPYRIEASLTGHNLSVDGAEMTTGISVTRGYECYDHIFSVSLVVKDAIDLTTHQNLTQNWELVVHLYSVEVQPFLVTNHVVKDPVLCRDVTWFVILIIAIPLIYFFFFVVTYRLKERYGCPPRCNEKRRPARCNGSDKKPLVEPAMGQNPSDCKSVLSSFKANTVSVTCTSPDQTKQALL